MNKPPTPTVPLTRDRAPESPTQRLLDFDMTLAVQTALLERLPVREVRAAFEDRGDGYGVLPFALRGTTARPETDLAVRLARAAAGEAAKGKLRSILDKVF